MGRRKSWNSEDSDFFPNGFITNNSDAYFIDTYPSDVFQDKSDAEKKFKPFIEDDAIVSSKIEKELKNVKESKRESDRIVSIRKNERITENVKDISASLKEDEIDMSEIFEEQPHDEKKVPEFEKFEDIRFDSDSSKKQNNVNDNVSFNIETNSTTIFDQADKTKKERQNNDKKKHIEKIENYLESLSEIIEDVESIKNSSKTSNEKFSETTAKIGRLVIFAKGFSGEKIPVSFIKLNSNYVNEALKRIDVVDQEKKTSFIEIYSEYIYSIVLLTDIFFALGGKTINFPKARFKKKKDFNEEQEFTLPASWMHTRESILGQKESPFIIFKNN